MTEQVRVVDGDAPERPPVAPPRSNWLLFALGFAVGVGVAVVFITPAGVTTPTATTIDPIASPVTPTEAGEEESGIAEVVEGFPDALVALVEIQSRSLNHLLWPVAGPPVQRPLPAGSFGIARFDASGRWLASTTAIPGEVGSALSMGLTTSLTPLVSGVTSFAWHDSESGELAYIRVFDGEGSLWTARPNRTSRLVIEGLGPRVTVSSWGDWGFALQDPEEVQIVLYTPEGEFRSVIDGVGYGSHPTGWIAASDGELILVSAGGGVSRIGSNLEAVGAVMSVEFSPDRSLIAVRGDRGLLVVDSSDGGEVAMLQVPGDNPDLAWSSDSRFVIFPHFRGVLVMDITSSTTTTVLGHRSVPAVGVIPLTGS